MLKFAIIVWTSVFLVLPRPAQPDTAIPPGADTAGRLADLYNRLLVFQGACGRFPKTSEGLEALDTTPKNLECKPPHKASNYSDWDLDGYGKRFIYKSDGTHYRVDASHGYFVTDTSPANNGKTIPGNVNPKQGAAQFQAPHWENPSPPKESWGGCSPVPGENTQVCW